MYICIIYIYKYSCVAADNALLTQSRFILMEPILLIFTMLGILFLLKFDEYSAQREATAVFKAWTYACLAATFLTLAICTKFVGFYTACLAAVIVSKRFWNSFSDATQSDALLVIRGCGRCLVFAVLPITIYLTIFWIHLTILHRAGPHDMVMTSAFQVCIYITIIYGVVSDTRLEILIRPLICRPLWMVASHQLPRISHWWCRTAHR